MTIQWSPHARADLRAIDRETAMRILRNLGQRRLRIGDWRIRFQPRVPDTIRIPASEHRGQAYR